MGREPSGCLAAAVGFCCRPFILHLKRRTLFRPALPPIRQPRGRNGGMFQPLLHFGRVSKSSLILLANSNQWYFNNLVKNPCHKTHCWCPHRLNLSFQSSRSCALPNIKILKDKGLEFANSIPPFFATSQEL